MSGNIHVSSMEEVEALQARAPVSAGPPGMNQLERSYADRLAVMQTTGAVAAWWYQAITLKLADDCRYTPDFMVQRLDGVIELHETKGFMRDDAAVKLKVAARMYPYPVFLCRKQSKKLGGGWDVQPVSA